MAFPLLPATSCACCPSGANSDWGLGSHHGRSQAQIPHLITVATFSLHKPSPSGRNNRKIEWSLSSPDFQSSCEWAIRATRAGLPGFPQKAQRCASTPGRCELKSKPALLTHRPQYGSSPTCSRWVTQWVSNTLHLQCIFMAVLHWPCQQGNCLCGVTMERKEMLKRTKRLRMRKKREGKTYSTSTAPEYPTCVESVLKKEIFAVGFFWVWFFFSSLFHGVSELGESGML